MANVVTSSDPGAPQTNGDGSTAAQIAQVVAPITAVVGVFTSLAVSGVLGQAERNHGTALALSLGFVAAGAVAWLIALLIPPPVIEAQPEMLDFQKRMRGEKTGEKEQGLLARFAWFIRRLGSTLLKMLGGVLVGAGVIIGVVALVWTQKDVERPAVTASFTKPTSILNATVTDNGLSSDDRLVVLVQGLNEVKKADKLQLVADPKNLYYAVIGPDADGKIDHTLSVVVPKTYKLVGVKAWSGNSDRGCTIVRELEIEGGEPAGKEDGCLALRLPRGKSYG